MREVLIVVAGVSVLALLTWAFWPAEKCSVIHALQIGTTGLGC